MAMRNEYTFDVVAVEPSGLISYNGGRAFSARKFKVRCPYAQEFALRLLGKFYSDDYTTPELPAYFPTSLLSPVKQQMLMVADSFEIQPADRGQFNTKYWEARENPGDPEVILYDIVDPAEFDTVNLKMLERYYTADEDGEPTETTCEDRCIVTVNYSDCPWDCEYLFTPDDSADWALNTALSVEKVPSYELYTLPNRNLEWVVGDSGISPSHLKGDSHATTIIPQADIAIYWHNIPVANLCAVEAHLTKFLSCVNSVNFTALGECECAAAEVSPESCSASENPITHGCGYEKDTLLFFGWEEDRSKRTSCFRLMNTTTLKLIFKQKRIVLATPVNSDDDVCGWNHSFCDATVDSAISSWREVQYKDGITYRPMFLRKDFNKILTMENPDS